MLSLLAEYSHLFGPLNVFRYITFRAACAAATALFFVFFFGPEIIDALRAKQGKGQPIREDGPASHLVTKKGTPTIGGLMILSGLVAATLMGANLRNPYTSIVLYVTVAFGSIGFYDDYLKVTKQSHFGFSGWLRLGFEFAIGIGVCYLMMRAGGEDMHKVAIPILKGYLFDVGWLFPDIRGVRHRRGGQLRQSHGRARRARHRAVDDRRRNLRDRRLSRRQQRLLLLSRHQSRRGRRRADDHLRVDDRRGPWVPCGSTRRRRRSSWAIRDRSRSAGSSAPSRWP